MNCKKVNGLKSQYEWVKKIEAEAWGYDRLLARTSSRLSWVIWKFSVKTAARVCFVWGCRTFCQDIKTVWRYSVRVASWQSHALWNYVEMEFVKLLGTVLAVCFHPSCASKAFGGECLRVYRVKCPLVRGDIHTIVTLEVLYMALSYVVWYKKKLSVKLWSRSVTRREVVG